jgi:hypothetical protein
MSYSPLPPMIPIWTDMLLLWGPASSLGAKRSVGDP